MCPVPMRSRLTAECSTAKPGARSQSDAGLPVAGFDAIAGPLQRLTSVLEHVIDIGALSELEKLLRNPYGKVPGSLKNALREAIFSSNANLWEVFFNEMLAAIWEASAHVKALDLVNSMLTESQLTFDGDECVGAWEPNDVSEAGSVQQRSCRRKDALQTQPRKVSQRDLQPEQMQAPALDEYEAVILKFRASVSDECVSSPNLGERQRGTLACKKTNDTACAAPKLPRQGDAEGSRLAQVANKIQELRAQDEAKKLEWSRLQREDEEKVRFVNLSKKLQAIREFQEEQSPSAVIPGHEQGVGKGMCRLHTDVDRSSRFDHSNAVFKQRKSSNDKPNDDLTPRSSSNDHCNEDLNADTAKASLRSSTCAKQWEGARLHKRESASQQLQRKLQTRKQTDTQFSDKNVEHSTDDVMVHGDRTVSAGLSRLRSGKNFFKMQISRSASSVSNESAKNKSSTSRAEDGRASTGSTECEEGGGVNFMKKDDLMSALHSRSRGRNSQLDDDMQHKSTERHLSSSSSENDVKQKAATASRPRMSDRKPVDAEVRSSARHRPNEQDSPSYHSSREMLEANRSGLLRLRQKSVRLCPEAHEEPDVNNSNEIEAQDPRYPAIPREDDVLRGLQIAQRALSVTGVRGPMGQISWSGSRQDGGYKEDEESQDSEELVESTYTPRTAFRNAVERVTDLIEQGTEEHLQSAKEILQNAVDQARLGGLKEAELADAFECHRKIVKASVRIILLSFRELDTGSVAGLKNVKHRLTDLMMDARAHGISEADLAIAETTRRRLHNSIEDLKGSIRVFCRLRPLSQREIEQGDTCVIKKLDTMTLEVERDSSRSFSRSSSRPLLEGEDGRRLGLSLEQESSGVEVTQFEYDTVFAPGSQDDVFQECRELIQSAFDGYHVTIFAYGQTGAGKTYTMLGTHESPGLTSKIIDQIYCIVSQQKERFEHRVKLSMVELYRNELVDLLQLSSLSAPSQAKRVAVRIDKEGSVHIENVLEEECTDKDDLADLIERGTLCRRTASTAINADSSRSHLIKTIKIICKNRELGETLTGKILLVDLAGSERLKKSLATGDAQKETIEINRSLRALIDVIEALAQGRPSVPYREHKLTQILQDSLGQSSKTLMFVHCSPARSNLNETLDTLKYASRAKSIKRNVHARPASVPAAQVRRNLPPNIGQRSRQRTPPPSWKDNSGL